MNGGAFTLKDLTGDSWEGSGQTVGSVMMVFFSLDSATFKRKQADSLFDYQLKRTFFLRKNCTSVPVKGYSEMLHF